MNYRRPQDLDQALTGAARQARAYDPSSWEGFGPYTPDVLNQPNAYAATEIEGMTFQDLKRMFPNAQETINQLVQGGVLNTKTHKYLVQNNGNVYALDKNKQYYFHPEQMEAIKNIHLNSQGPNLTLIDPRQTSSMYDPMPYGQALGKNEPPTIGQQIGQGLSNAWGNVTGWFGKAGEWLSNWGNTVQVPYTDEKGQFQIATMTKQEAEELSNRADTYGLLGTTQAAQLNVPGVDPLTIAAGAALTYAAAHPEALEGILQGASDFNTKAQAWGAAGLGYLLGMPWLAKREDKTGKPPFKINMFRKYSNPNPTNNPDKDPKEPGKGLPWWVPPAISGTINAAEEIVSGTQDDQSSRKGIQDSGVYDDDLGSNDEWASALPSGIDHMLFEQVSQMGGKKNWGDFLKYTAKFSGTGMDLASMAMRRGIKGPKFGFLGSISGTLGTVAGIGLGKGINYIFHKDGIHKYLSASDLSNGASKNSFIAFDGPSGSNATFFLVPFSSGGKTKYTNMYLQFDPETMITDDDPSDKNRVVVRRIMEADPAIDAKVGDWIIGIYSPGSEDGTVPPGVEVYNLKFSSSPRNATLQTKLANEYFPDSNLNYGNKPAQETEDEKPKNPYNPSKPDTLGVVKPKPTPVKTTDESDDERIRRILRANNDTREPSTLSSSEKKRLLWKDDNDKKVSN